jgi:hypothetical protein
MLNSAQRSLVARIERSAIREASSRSRVTEMAASSVRDRLEAGLNEAACCGRALWALEAGAGDEVRRRAVSACPSYAGTGRLNRSEGRRMGASRGVVGRRQAGEARRDRFSSMRRWSEEERRHGDKRYGAQRAELEVSRHEVSQRGAVCRGAGERGRTPISTMRPPQTGHRSMRWPVRMA